MSNCEKYIIKKMGGKGGVFRALHHILLPSSFQQPRPFAETDCSGSSSFSTTLILIACPSSVFIHYTVTGLSSGVGASKVSPRLTIWFLQLSRSKDIFIPSHTHTPSFRHSPTPCPEKPSPPPELQKSQSGALWPVCVFLPVVSSIMRWPLPFICDCLFACSLWGFYCIVFSSPFPLLGAISLSTVLWGLSRRSSVLRFTLFGVSLASVFLCLISLPSPSCRSVLLFPFSFPLFSVPRIFFSLTNARQRLIQLNLVVGFRDVCRNRRGYIRGT